MQTSLLDAPKWKRDPAKQREYNAAYYAARRDKIRADQAAARAANRENELARHAEYRAQNKEKIRASSADYYQRNKGECAARARAWWAANPEAKRRASAARRSRGGTIGKLSRGIVQKLQVLQRHKCASCAQCIRTRPFELDHIVPLALGGRNEDHNIQLLCKTCNRRKHAKEPIAWAQINGRLL